MDGERIYNVPNGGFWNPDYIQMSFLHLIRINVFKTILILQYIINSILSDENIRQKNSVDFLLKFILVKL